MAHRISKEEAFALFDKPLAELGSLACAARRRADPEDCAGFIVNRMINYSNICRAQCEFCAYHAKAGIVAPFRTSDDEILALCRDAVDRGGVQIMLQGGLHPDFTLFWAENLLRRIKSEFGGGLWLHVFSPSEIVWFARGAGVDIDECVARLKEAGADSVPGAADILVPEIRSKMCNNKCTLDEWIAVMRALAKNQMTSSATMTFGITETLSQRIEHLDIIRNLQDSLGLFKAFIVWPVSPEHTRIEGRVRRAGAVEFLKMLAISRIYLDNIKYVQSGWLTEGLKMAEVALNFGANDVGGVLMDEMVVRAAGIDNRAVKANMVRAIENAGLRARERDGLYRTLKIY